MKDTDHSNKQKTDSVARHTSPDQVIPHFDHKTVEPEWSRAWEAYDVHAVSMNGATKPFYNLMMFPYPSAEGLHVGNMYAFTGSDMYGRFKKMQGYDVFEPIGLDGFGIHSENYALKIGRHPMEHAALTQKRFYEQLHTIGAMFDWKRTLETYDPSYYRWTQWVFTQMFRHGLAYRGKAYVNWCPSCKTVLADEQVIDGKCERCGNSVEKRLLEQWFFRITAYAGKLHENIPALKWSQLVKTAQTNWIGKKEGINILYPVTAGNNEVIGEVTCFTTRPDTNYGATFVVLAPEHPFINQLMPLLNSGKRDEISLYRKKAIETSTQDRIAQGRKKSGVFTGFYCINKLNNERMPLYISDFVLMDFGTGAVVGVPGHDKRDFEFARVFGIPVKRVVVGSDKDQSDIKGIEQVQEDEGTMINSSFLDGLDIHEATRKMMDHLEDKGWGKRTATYHLRDWLISRQRYWGPPIPMVYCESCAKRKPFKILVIHGTWGSGEGNWFPWLKEELAKKGVVVETPTLPDTKLPVYETRMAFLKEHFGSFIDEDTVIIGHSSGAPTALQLAQSAKVKGLLLVAPVMEIDDAYERELAEAFDGKTAKGLRGIMDMGIDYDLIRKNAGEITVLFGENDPYLPKRFMDSARTAFGASAVHELPGYGHFSDATNDPKNFSDVLGYLPLQEVEMPGWHPVPDDQLPVTLPRIDDYKPGDDGVAPLAKHKEFYETKCPECGGKAVRETDVSDTFLDSSWYFLRYPSIQERNSNLQLSNSKQDTKIQFSNSKQQSNSKNKDKSKIHNQDAELPWDPEITKKWLPVDMYTGGAEHSVLHLLYSRFVTMALHDWGYLDSEEPYKNFFAHGLVIKDGAKMSKSKGNVVNPDEYIATYGADSLRMYLMFMGPFSLGGDFRDSAMEGVSRWVGRIWRMAYRSLQLTVDPTSLKLRGARQDDPTSLKLRGARQKDTTIVDSSQKNQDEYKTLEKDLNILIKKVGDDLEGRRYNTAIAFMMEYTNSVADHGGTLPVELLKKFLLILAPFAPYVTEELWQRIHGRDRKQFKKEYSIHLESWPKYEESALKQSEVQIVVQINGKTRDFFMVPAEDSQSQEAVEKKARASEKVAKWLDGVTVRKAIFVPGRLINFVV